MASFDPKTKVWEAKKVPYPYDMDVYLGEVILKACNETPDRIIQIHHEKKELLTCRNLKESSINIAENLMALGIKPDDVIGVLCHNSNFLTCFLAGSVITGAIVHPLDHSLNATNIGQLYAQSIPKMIICDPEMVGTLEEALAIANLKPMILITSDDSENDESKYSSVNLLLEPITAKYDAFKTPKFDKPADEKILAILCSSGITGLQKNVCVSHATCLQFDFKTYPKPPSKPLTFSSAYWSSGFFFHVLAPFYTDDVRLWSSDDFNIFKLIEIVETHKISDLNLAPSSLAAILSSDQFLKSEHTSLKRFVVIGSMLTESLRNKFRKIFPDKILMTEYGMTEVLVSLSKPDEIYNGITVGSMIAPNLTLKIVNEDGESVNPVERGEIRVKMQFQFLVSTKNKNKLDIIRHFRFLKNNVYIPKRGTTKIRKQQKMPLTLKGFLKQETLATLMRMVVSTFSIELRNRSSTKIMSFSHRKLRMLCKQLMELK